MFAGDVVLRDACDTPLCDWMQTVLLEALNIHGCVIEEINLFTANGKLKLFFQKLCSINDSSTLSARTCMVNYRTLNNL